ncbi:MAG TPA: metallophosphoesterase, partial [Tepidisphaeraceae bacterium]|nr:metallophosphoesterase [Tepidisphaeraceae bacterium]
TRRPRIFTEGAVSKHQLHHMAHAFDLNNRPIRIVVQHHPPVLSSREYHTAVARHVGWRRAIRSYAAMRVDLVLYGHLHLHQVEESHAHLIDAGRRMLCVMAGTAISTRVRDEPNSFNRITIEGERCTIESISLEADGFLCKVVKKYERTNDGWSTIKEGDAATAICETPSDVQARLHEN